VEFKRSLNVKCTLPSTILAATVAFFVALNGCEKKTTPTAPPKTPTGAPTTMPVPHDDHDHAKGEDHDHDHDHAKGDDHDHDHAAGGGHDDHDHGPVVELGSTNIGGFSVKASRDGAVEPGGEAPVDLWITPTAGAKVGVVRAWIGTQDAKGSVKARLDLEKDNYHNHVEVPKPLPADAKLWIEIEDEKNVKAVGSFDLKS
jgi:hypothetical protein